MITFRNITATNFMSVGNNPITIYLDRSPTTLITGTNGSGKSSIILDGLSFALFGKPHRKINKPQLVNSINERNCMVVVDFDIGHDKYTIKRGLYPATFEIWKNGTMLNQDSKARDYQNVLEQNILKLNHKSFHQIVVLGSSSFIPFMQLSKGHRREVIEDLLDITVFSTMNGILKEQRRTLQDSIFAVEAEIDSLKKQGEMQKKHIRHLKDLSSENAARIEEEIQSLTDKKEDLTDKLNKCTKELESGAREELAKRLDQLNDERKKLYGLEGKAKSKLASLEKNTEFYTSHDDCPTCKQKIADELKAKIVDDNSKETEEIKANVDKLDKYIKKIESESQELETSHKNFTDLSYRHSRYMDTISDLIKSITAKQAQLTNLTHDDSITEASENLSQIAETGLSKHKQKMELIEDMSYHGVMEELLKDSGIKTKIIKQYLPVMNRLINEYLQIFDFFVSFALDENFDESIRSRHRDEFTYASFSEGEKAKIDISLMLTWRQIAKMKNSTNTNILIMDEIFDQSLDQTGVENLMGIFKSIVGDTNIFVISHNSDHMAERFDRHIVFSKPNNFTEIEEIEDSI
jgi:DNA repair exonuclease SbcCD ATPase subunit